jgi:DNA (cytosine-5)-methyltransferase 1
LQRQRDEMLPKFPIWDDIRTFDGRPWRGLVDIVAGGFPCQDISCAGKGAGITGSRSGLWGEMARVIGEIRPRFAFVENSPMLVSRGLGVVLADLAEMGYDAWWGIVGAHHVGAPHKRDRIWIMAESMRDGRGSWGRELTGQQRESSLEQSSGKLAESRRELCETRDTTRMDDETQKRTSCSILNKSGCDGSELADAARRENDGRGRVNMAEAQECRCTWWKVDPAEVADADQQHDDASRHGTGAVFRKRQAPADIPGRETDLVGRGRLSNTSSGPAQSGLGRVVDGLDTGMDFTEAAFGEQIPRVATGVEKRIDRLKAIGNGQVPAVAAAAWEMLKSE